MDEAERKRINKLIYRLKKGDKEAEEILYDKYIGIIRLYVYNNVWIPEIKDRGGLIKNIWLKLRGWFSKKSNYIESSDSAVVYNLVRRECAAIARKDIREPAYGIDHSRNANLDFDDKRNLEFYKEILKSNAEKNREYSSNYEQGINFNVSFYTILSKCLRELDTRKKLSLNERFFKDKTYEEIGELISRSNVTAMNDINKALEKLRKCFNRHGVYSTGDLL